MPQQVPHQDSLHSLAKSCDDIYASDVFGLPSNSALACSHRLYLAQILVRQCLRQDEPVAILALATECPVQDHRMRTFLTVYLAWPRPSPSALHGYACRLEDLVARTTTNMSCPCRIVNGDGTNVTNCRLGNVIGFQVNFGIISPIEENAGCPLF